MRALAALLALLLCSPATAQEAVHGGPVRALAFSGDALASAGFDQSMIVWDAAAGKARAGCVPGRAGQRAMRPSSPAEAKPPPGSGASAFTAPACQRTTARAFPAAASQTIMDWSKPAEASVSPEKASARTGPPCTASCAAGRAARARAGGP